jgi:PTH1 family peptidyl-tRNA hydrolase
LSDRRTLAVVGLGNPGGEYGKTRHNIGFMVSTALAGNMEDARHSSGSTYLSTEGSIGGCALIVVWPLTFMNNSGYAVAEVCVRYGLAPDQTLIVSDDITLPLGTIRVRPKGAHGGHNGLRSVIAMLGTTGFPRIRCGIRSDAYTNAEDLADYVLSPFENRELAAVENMIARAANAAVHVATAGIEETMNQFNT